ncbi:MAG: adenylyltransferase/cytidyltransferase family protein, partial [Chloroflexi bacterium]|nr:adenylyltransferase/cytidyltransferase family protein [Chloroflexota bacterium]
MRVVRSLDDVTPGQPFAITVGAFDGVHLGHQFLFRQLRSQAAARGAATLAITFDPDPAEVVSPNPPPYLTSLQQKTELIAALGIDELCVLEFDERIKAMTAQEFMDEIRERIVVSELLVGHDFAMGRDRQGTRDVLIAYAQRHDFACATAPPFEVDGKPVSASRIRSLLAGGKVEDAATLLGRPPSVEGIVVEGDKRGRQIGFPTANLGLAQRWAIPADGVYVAYTFVSGRRWQSV